MPAVTSSRAHKSVLLDGVKLPKPALSPGEAESVRRSNERGGFRGRGGDRGFGGRGGDRGFGGRGGPRVCSLHLRDRDCC